MNNLETVKPGDLVTIFSDGNPSRIRMVDRVTKTRIIINDNDCVEAWRKKDGLPVGYSPKFNVTYMKLYAPKDREYIRRQNLIYKVIILCTRDQFEKLTTKQINAVYEIMSGSDQSAATKKGGQK